MGEGFILNELHFSSANATMDSWCTVGLGEGQEDDAHVPVLVAGQLVAGNAQNCFYCGARNHEASQCPTRQLKNDGQNVWTAFADITIDEINSAFREIDATLTSQEQKGYARLISGDTTAALLLKTCFEINHPVQLREAERMWSQNPARAREDLYGMKEAEEEEVVRTIVTRDRDESAVWFLLDRFSKANPGDLGKMERDVQTAISRSPRDVRLRGLLGFVFMERADAAHALNAWHEAEMLAGTSTQQAWLQFLQARLLEVSGRHMDAQDMYQAVLRLAPHWREADYRQIVCRVKMGFAEQVTPHILRLIGQDPNCFNRLLIDPELERGHLIILTALFPTWSETQLLALEERAHLDRLATEVQAWFPDDYPVAGHFRVRIEELSQLAGVNNYLAFLRVIRNRPVLENEILQQIHKEIDVLQDSYKDFLSVLEIVRDEASWFPFPRVLVEFNRDFNECANIINWAFSANFYDTNSFKQAQAYIPQITELLKRLQKRLRFLRVVRDTTLFVLVLLRTFFFLEIAGALLCLIIVPAVAIYGDQFGMNWLKMLIRSHHWELMKVLLSIISIMSLGSAVLRTTLIFERKRERLLADARQHREQMQQKRLDRIRTEQKKKTGIVRKSPFDRPEE
jgi:tetratricopeptide (TPR) repeat protein